MIRTETVDRKDLLNLPGLVTAIALAAALIPCSNRLEANELRTSTLANATLALDDRDTGVNPYDFGRNPAWLLNDIEFSYIRFFSNLEEVSGDLRRQYDPHLENDRYAGFQGVRKLGERHAATGHFDYRWLWQREVYHSIENDQYNDPFYLTDLTTGDFEYSGPRTSVDYSFRLFDMLYVGGGFDYEINTGLKQEYTRPEIDHNYFRGNFGIAWLPTDRNILGLVYRPLRNQNKTYLDDTDEGIDNLIHFYVGDDLFETRNVGSYTIAEVAYGHETMLQAFHTGRELQLGLTAAYQFNENDITYGTSKQYAKGRWEEDRFDIRFRGRWSGRGPLSVGASGRYFNSDGWAVRPAFSDVVVYETPFVFYEGGLGFSYDLSGADMTFTGEYVLRKYDAEVSDYSGDLYRESDVTTNIGRFAMEKRILNVYSFRAGFEYTDYPVDRWLKLPMNIDIMRFSAGGGYYVGGFEIDLHLEYEDWSKDDLDIGRRGLGATVWLTRIVD